MHASSEEKLLTPRLAADRALLAEYRACGAGKLAAGKNT
jgi:hypothetical protein